MKTLRCWLLIVIGLWTTPLIAQFYFGQNKIQYHDFNWSFIQSEHFDLYFTDNNYKLAEFAINAAESAYVKIRTDFNYSINARISFIIYGAHTQFQQTNAIQGYLDEGIGGVTELFKNRIVLPFQGDFQQFAHVIHHELVHAVINDMYYGGSLQNVLSSGIQLNIPLWFNEGLAEFSALEWDSNTDQFMRDAVINNYLNPIPQLSGYFAYRGGQSVWYYVTQKYGREKIAEILQRIRSTRDVQQAFVGAIGLNYEELTERWMQDLKVRYWPEIASRTDVNTVSRRLVNHRKDGSNYNTSPSISPKGDRVVYMTDINQYIDLYVMSGLDGKNRKKVIDGQRSRDFEELHLLTPGVSWSPDGKRIAVATKAGNEDAIMLINVDTGDDEKITVGLDGIFSVDWSRDGRLLAFQGLKNGQSDLFIYNLETKNLQNLTNDMFSDMDPGFSPDSKKLVFVSDRQDYHADWLVSSGTRLHELDIRAKDLFELDIETGRITRLTRTPGVEETNPVYVGSNEHVIYISDQNGAYNLWHMNLVKQKVRPLTDLLQGVQQLSVTYDGSRLVFSALSYAGYDIYSLSNPLGLSVGDSLSPNLWARFRDSARKPSPLPDVPPVISETAVADSISSFVFVPADPNELKVLTADTLDFSNYDLSVPDEADEGGISSVFGFAENNKTETGDFRVYDYKLNFSPDLIYGNANVSSLYGVSGQTNMLFSDMLGNHQIFFATNLVMDLKNSDLFLAYYYLPERLDYGVFGYHSSRYFGVLNPLGFYDVYRYRNYGGGLSIAYPLDKFNRFSLDLGYSILSRENLEDVRVPIEETWFFNPKLQFIHDTSLWGVTGPGNGSRYGIQLYTVPPALSNKLNFFTTSFDYRTYFRITDYTSFAVRAAGALSNGGTPQKFFIGGVENWLNVQVQNRANFPITSLEDFVFAEAALPLRGHDLNAQNGSRYAVTNVELRYPMLFWLLPEVGDGAMGTFFMGTLFTDLGTAWSDDRRLQLMGLNEQNQWGLQDLLAGSGVGVRTFLAYFLVRFDVAWRWDFRQSSKPQYYLSLGADF